MDSIWTQHEAVIRHLYQIERKTLKQVKEILESQYGFPKKPLAQYETGLRDILGFRKKLKAEHWPMVFTYARSKGYDSFDVYIGDTRIPWKRAWKEIRRSGAHKLSTSLRDQQQLPSGVRIEALPSETSIPRAVATRNTCLQTISSQSTPEVFTPCQRSSKSKPWSSSRTSQFALNNAATSNALVQGQKVVLPTPPSNICRGGSSLGSRSWDISGFAKSLLDTLPWHQYRFASYAVLVAGKRLKPVFENSGHYSFAIMPVDKFCSHKLGQSTARVSDSSYPSISEVLSLRKSLDTLASHFDIYHFLATMTYLVSNCLVPTAELLVDIIDILQRGVSRNVVMAFFSNGLDSTRAVWDTLFDATQRLLSRRSGFRAMHFLVEVLLDSQRPWLGDVRNRLLWQVALSGHVGLTRRLLLLGAVLDYREAEHDRFSIIAAASSESESCAAVLIENCDTNTNLKSFPCGPFYFDGIFFLRCEVFHHESDAPMSHFSLFLNSAITEPQRPIEEYEKVLRMLIHSGADVDLVFFNSCTLSAYRHGGIESIPWSWMPTCLDMCYYWNRPLFHRLRTYSSRVNECLTRAGVCEAALAGEDALAAYLETASAYSTAEKMRYLELVLIEHFNQSIPGYTKPRMEMGVVKILINFGVLVVPLKLPRRHLTPPDSATDLFIQLTRSAATYGFKDDTVYVMRHLYQHGDINKLRALYAVVEHAGAPLLQALSLVISSDLVTKGPYVLARAVNGNHTEAISWLLNNGVDVNSEVRTADDTCLTILGYAGGESFLPGEFGRGSPTEATWRRLIEYGANLRRQTTDTNCYELLKSVLTMPKWDHLKLFKLFSEHSAEFEKVTEGQWHDLILHCARSLEYYTNLHDRQATPMLEVFEAIYFQHSTLQLGPVLAGYIGGGGSDLMIKELLARGASINAYTRRFTPLQAAAARANAPLVSQLIDLGARVNATPPTGHFGLTALQAICAWEARSPADYERKTSIILLLLERGARIDGDGHHSTPLQECAALGDIVNASLLAQHGANPNICSIRPFEGGNLMCALDSAAHNGRLDMTRYLLGLGALSARPGSTGYEGAVEEAFSKRRGYGRYEAVAMLIESHSRELARQFEQEPEILVCREAGIEQHKARIRQKFPDSKYYK